MIQMLYRVVVGPIRGTLQATLGCHSAFIWPMVELDEVIGAANNVASRAIGLRVERERTCVLVDEIVADAAEVARRGLHH